MVKLGRALLLAVPLLAVPLPATAPVELAATLVNRYLSLVVTDERQAQVIVSLLHGDLPAAELRRAMDADHDGHISDGEMEAERRAWLARMDELLRVAVDGQPVHLEPVVSVDLAGEPRVTARPLVVELAASVPLSRGVHEVTLTPGRDRPRAGETELTVDLGPLWDLVRSRQGSGEDTRPVQRRFTFAGPRVSMVEDRSVTFVIAPVEAAASSGVQPQLVASLVAGALALALGLTVWRRRRPPS